MILSNDRKANNVIRLNEKQFVENPLLDQLEGLGWTVIRLEQKQEPAESQRSHFGEVFLRPCLQEALCKINPFLTSGQVSDVIHRTTEFPAPSLIENNRRALSLLLENTTVQVNHQTGEASPTVRLVDFDRVENNSFVAISQFKVRVPGTEHHIVPDVVLFVNGLPLVTIECKSPKVKEPIAEGIDQLMRYSQQRGDEGPEGNRELFYYNQFIIATCRNTAKFGTITTGIEKHFYRWLDPYPFMLDQLEHGISTPNDQQRMIAGMCSPRNLLDIVRSFTLFGTDDKGKTIKIVARYQQFRAVKLIVQRLLQGRSRRERSGIIWHTQGSGKSLTMMFTVREMRRHVPLMGWKVIFVTDRTQLQDQLTETGKAIGYTVKVADSSAKLRELLANDSPDLVMVMMQKFQDQDLKEIYPELNASPHNLLMVDEAHRTQYKLLGANLDKAMPNATRVAYTGTPIDKTERTFGEYIDKYTMHQSVIEGTTLGIVYEGRTHKAEITDRSGLDKRFEDVFSDYNLQERLQILGYGSRDAYLEAEDVIVAKAEDMLRHYVQHVFPNGFKAQVVATSREAAVRYKKALDSALTKIVEELEQKNPFAIDMDRLRRMETAVVISGGINDKLHLKAYTEETYHRKAIRRFKLPFDAQQGQGDEAVDGRVGIIVVNNMLLTGFDASIEQVLYLDRVIVAHNLLQAIARVNRLADEKKEKGFVIDYVGIGNHLKKALDSYREREQKDVLETIEDPENDLAELIQAHREIWDLLKGYGIKDFSDTDAFFDLFYDEEIRFAYILAFKKLTRAFNLVMPSKEALDYFEDYMNFAEVNELASKHLRDSRLSMKGIPDKLRLITDEFLKSKGIRQKIAPISILDDDFQKGVQTHKRNKTRAAEIEHAIRQFIDVNLPEDPELFSSFAAELERILKEFADNWEQVYNELEKLRQKILSKEKEQTYGLDRRKQMPIFRIIKAEAFGNQDLTEDQIAQNVNITQHLFNLIAQEVSSAGFWNSAPAQSKLKADLQELLLSDDFKDIPNLFAKRKEIISRLMEWARENHAVIIRP